METYKFEKKIKKNGIIKIPELEGYANQKVDIIVTLKPKEEDKPVKNDFDDFLEKWTGFFPPVKTDDIKYNYLMEKYK